VLGATRGQEQSGLLVDGCAAEAESFHHLYRGQEVLPLGHRTHLPTIQPWRRMLMGLTDYTGVVQPAMVELSDPLFR
jgi:hypothetical protein